MDPREAAHLASLPDRAAAGAVYTPPASVDQLVSLGLAGVGDRPRVLDPACGCGAILVGAFDALLARAGGGAANARRVVADQLYGLDIDAPAVAIARERLLEAQRRAGVKSPVEPRVCVGDALLETPAPVASGGFDLVVANPPYVRHERLEPSYKAALARRYAGRVPASADLSLYFFARGLELLAPGGLQVYLASDSWLDVAAARPWRQHLLATACLEAVHQGDESPFDDASIHPVISVIRHQPPAAGARTGFAKRCQEPFFVAQAALARSEHWAGDYLRAPALYSALLAAAGEALVPLAELAELGRGWTSGANDFFFVRVLADDGTTATIRCDDGSEHQLESVCLGERLVVKARELLGPRLDPERLPYRLVRPNPRLPLAAAYLAWGVAQGYAARPTLRSRAVWYAADHRPPCDLLLPIGHKRRAAVGLATGLRGSDNLVEVRLRDPAHAELVAASALAAFSLLAFEALGRANFGQGLLKTQTYELARLPVLDPRRLASAAAAELTAAFVALAGREQRIVYDEFTLADRRRLDAAWLAAAGVAVGVDELHAETSAAIRRRQARWAASPEARGVV